MSSRRKRAGARRWAARAASAAQASTTARKGAPRRRPCRCVSCYFPPLLLLPASPHLKVCQPNERAERFVNVALRAKV